MRVQFGAKFSSDSETQQQPSSLLVVPLAFLFSARSPLCSVSPVLASPGHVVLLLPLASHDLFLPGVCVLGVRGSWLKLHAFSSPSLAHHCVELLNATVSSSCIVVPALGSPTSLLPTGPAALSATARRLPRNSPAVACLLADVLPRRVRSATATSTSPRCPLLGFRPLHQTRISKVPSSFISPHGGQGSSKVSSTVWRSFCAHVRSVKLINLEFLTLLFCADQNRTPPPWFGAVNYPCVDPLTRAISGRVHTRTIELPAEGV
ncbi:uncharacterized protein [Zea mays]|uniref:uncharacterized protein n=1 Tax=Zea mays TaxID=4577 RepID=UPI0009A9C613|nr:uncharacterized protein LOC109944230 [Zea mays]|eukprot:XP_020404512.1 uncharacterized protein LOC109944230 [Zea mays]